MNDQILFKRLTPGQSIPRPPFRSAALVYDSDGIFKVVDGNTGQKQSLTSFDDDQISVTYTGNLSSPFPALRLIPSSSVLIDNVLYEANGKWLSMNYAQGTAPETLWNSFSPTNFSSSGALTLIGVKGAREGMFTDNNSQGKQVPFVTSFSAPDLEFIGSSFQGRWLALTSVNLPNLMFILGDFYPVMNSVQSIALPKLKHVGANFRAYSTALINLSLPSIDKIYGQFDLQCPGCTTLTLPPLGTWKYLGGDVLSNTSLNQASVDSLLEALAYMDGNNGTVVYGSGRSVSLAANASAPSSITQSPSEQINGDKFTVSGTTCTVQASGYEQGDVVTVSGVTTAKTANATAIVVSSTETSFTYSCPASFSVSVQVGDPSTDIFTATNHGMGEYAILRFSSFVNVSGGSVGFLLNQNYFVRDVTQDTFKLSTSNDPNNVTRINIVGGGIINGVAQVTPVNPSVGTGTATVRKVEGPIKTLLNRGVTLTINSP